MKRLATATALTLLAAASASCAAQTDASATVHVAACGLEVDLPAGYKISRPKRQHGTQDGQEGRQCAFDVVKAKPDPPQRGDCKDKDEGGQPPCDVCDWVIPLPGNARPAERVVRAQPERRRNADPFVRGDDGRWMLPNAQAGDQRGEPFDFHGKPAWRGETITRPYWVRQRIKDFTGIYAGSGDTAVTVVQFAPDLYVQLQDPPADERSCTVFCRNLRLGARAQDLP